MANIATIGATIALAKGVQALWQASPWFNGAVQFDRLPERLGRHIDEIARINCRSVPAE
jgi:hypothetical protein